MEIFNFINGRLLSLKEQLAQKNNKYAEAAPYSHAKRKIACELRVINARIKELDWVVSKMY